MKPKHPEGWFNGFDFQAYRSMTGSLPEGGRMVEIGAFKGRSLSSIANQILEQNLQVLAVDPFLEFLLDESAIQQTDSRLAASLARLGFDIPSVPEPEFQPFPDEVEAIFKRTMSDWGLTENVRLTKRTSEEASKLVPDGSLDFVFIDGDHTGDAVTFDVYAWWPKLKPTGFMGGHDYLASGGTELMRKIRSTLEEIFTPEGLSKQHHKRSSCWIATQPPKLIELVSYV